MQSNCGFNELLFGTLLQFSVPFAEEQGALGELTSLRTVVFSYNLVIWITLGSFYLDRDFGDVYMHVKLRGLSYFSSELCRSQHYWHDALLPGVSWYNEI